MHESLGTQVPEGKAGSRWRRLGFLGWLGMVLSAGGAGAQTPPQSWAGWARVEVAPSELGERRQRMLAELREAGGGTLLVPGGDGLSDGETFRQEDDFWYLTGLEVPRSLLVLDAEAGARLFVPARDFRFENPTRANDFPGRALAADPELSRRSGISDVEDAARLPEFLEELARGDGPVWVHADPRPEGPRLFGPPATAAERLVAWWNAQWPERSLRSAMTLFARTRGPKTVAELERVRAVTDLTASAILEAAAQVRPGVDERSLEAEFEAACKRGGAQRIPFHPIIKSGPNALWPWRVLASHYDRRNRVLDSGDLVIFDVGCELDRYLSDVGRTFPASGTFSPEQRAALEMEVAVADRIIAAVRPGVTFADLRAVAYEAIPDGEERYMQVGSFFGHAIGLSTGDPFDVEAPLVPGVVFTIEPWYYNHDTGISVFTEDVVVVTESGVEVLTAGLPRDPDALEAVVRGGRR